MNSTARRKAPVEPDTPERKNVWVEGELHQRLKQRALERRVPLQSLVEEYLQWALQEEPKESKRKR